MALNWQCRSKNPMKPLSVSTRLVFTVILTAISHCPQAQSTTGKQPDLKRTILYHDSIFWKAYNSCDIATMQKFVTQDVEFYHDKGGLTTSSEKLIEAIRRGLCGSPDWRLRREPVSGSIQVFELEQYGALLSGEHVFYVLEKGRNERLDGLAKFTHVWRYKDGEWKMHRILSYDHGPAPYLNKRTAIVLSEKAMKKFVGTYHSQKAGVVNIEQQGGELTLMANNSQLILFPESESIFFVKERDLRAEFVTQGKKLTMQIYENGELVDRLPRIGK